MDFSTAPGVAASGTCALPDPGRDTKIKIEDSSTSSTTAFAGMRLLPRHSPLDAGHRRLRIMVFIPNPLLKNSAKPVVLGQSKKSCGYDDDRKCNQPRRTDSPVGSLTSCHIAPRGDEFSLDTAGALSSEGRGSGVISGTAADLSSMDTSSISKISALFDGMAARSVTP